MRTIPPLLVIAEGRKPRPRKAAGPAPKEYALHISVADTLRLAAAPDWLWWHTPNGELRDPRTGARLKRMGVKPGVPDFVLISPYGSVRLLELKRRGESLSEPQEEIRVHCIRQGIPYAVAFSLDEAVAALNAWGALRPIGGAS